MYIIIINSTNIYSVYKQKLLHVGGKYENISDYIYA